jgi:hypothetical protein
MNVTLKEFPEDLHSRLKSIAERSGRSLNRQIIYMLDSATSPRKVDDADLLHRIKANRRRISGRIDQQFLERAISDGRK